MSIETATTPDQFNVAWPLDTDPESQGAGHLRLIKTVVQTAYDAQQTLNTTTATNVATATASAATATTTANTANSTATSALSIANSATTTANSAASTAATAVTTANTANASATTAVAHMCPSGTIVAFYGSTIPTGWVLCNGQNGTPNLEGCLILGSPNSIVSGSGSSGPTLSTTVPTTGASGGPVNPLTVVSLVSIQYIMKT